MTITYIKSIGEISETMICDTTAELREALQIVEPAPMTTTKALKPTELEAMYQAIELARRIRDGDFEVSPGVRSYCAYIITKFEG